MVNGIKTRSGTGCLHQEANIYHAVSHKIYENWNIYIGENYRWKCTFHIITASVSTLGFFSTKEITYLRKRSLKGKIHSIIK